MSRSPHAWSRALAALALAACLVSEPAFAVNLGDTPENRAALDSTCTRIDFLGPMVTAWCWDKNDLPIKSRVEDVRACAFYQVVVDATAHIHCRARARK
jgi:hypothetical protein